MNPDDLMALINSYYNDPESFSDEEAEVIAGLTRQLGMHFDRERKPIRKLHYGAGEMTTFGLLPDSLKPHSRGQDVYGETAIDAIASGAGSLLGLAGGIGGAYKAGRGIMRSDRARDVGGKIMDAGKTARDMANPSIENVRRRIPNFDGILMRTRGY